MTMDDHPSFEDLSAYHDGEAPELAAHVAGCEACGATVAELVALSAAVAEPLPSTGMPGGDPDADPVSRAVAASSAGPRPGSGRRRRRRSSSRHVLVVTR
ncbi:MAG TPA: hypothetical protein VG455_15465 [Acidimicrobiales bacterium]|nr:hypothetical protein [Acidimicrobiales bacterium]